MSNITKYLDNQRREAMPLDLSGGDYENIYYIRKENTAIIDNYNLVGCFSMPDRFEAECGSYDITDDDADNRGSQILQHAKTHAALVVTVWDFHTMVMMIAG